MALKKIRKLTISGFRGIRYDITLDFTNRNKSLLLFGANAKGKSSIADAFEWFITGDIKELTKEGCTRDDYRHRLLDRTTNTIVSFEFSDPDLNSDIILKASRKQKYSNDGTAFKEYLHLSNSELLILRHKDLKKFVDETKGEKRKQIAQLIGMEEWEKIRNDMGAVENRLSESMENQFSKIEERQGEVTVQIETKIFSKDKCWKYGEKQANILGLDQKISSLKDLRAADEKAKRTTISTDRSAKLVDLNNAESVLKETIDKTPKTVDLQKYTDAYNQLCADPQKVLWALLNELYKQGKSLLQSGQWDNDSCPLCYAPIPRDELIAHIEGHQEKNKEIQEEIAQFEQTRKKAKIELKQITNLIGKINVLKLDDAKGIEKPKEVGTEVALSLANAESLVEQPLRTKGAFDLERLGLKNKLGELVEVSKKALADVKKAQKSLSPTEEETARIEAFQNLSTLASHMAALDAMELGVAPLEKQVSSMKSFTTAFQDLRRYTMGNVLKTISDDVARYFFISSP